MKRLKLFFACLLMAVLSIGQVWADSVAATLTAGTNGTAATVNEKTAIKVGTSKKSGDMTITVGAGATTLNLHAVAWSGAAGTIDLSAPTGVTLSQTSLSLSANSNISGTGTDYTIETEADYLFTITLSGVEAETAITLTGATTSGKAKRFVVWEATYETGSTPPAPAKTLESVAVSGTPTKTSYTAGEDFDPAGLVVTGHYSEGPDEAITSGITWAYNPAQVLEENQTSIGVTATVGEISSDEYNVTGLSVTEAPLTVTFDYADYKGEGASSSGANYTMVKTQVSIGDTKFYGNNSQAHFYANGITTITPAAGVTITQIVLTATSADYNGYQSNGTVTASAGSLSHDGVVVAWTGFADEAFTISHNKQIRWTSIVVFYEQGEAPAVDKPTISGETPFLNSTTVTINKAEGTTVYYTTDGSDPKTSDTKQTYSAAFNLSANATVKAIATDGANWSEPVEKSFVKATVLSVAEARAAIDAGGDLSNKFVAGTISQIDSYQSNYHSITYWISDDGTTTDQLEVYSGLAGVVKAQFESVNDLAVGDDVTVKGTLKKYNSTYEFDYNNTIVAYKPIARLAWSETSYNADIDDPTSNVYPTLTNTNGVTVAYSSDNTDAATIDPATGDITLVAVGSTTITASFAGNGSYKANSASYTLNVASSLVHATISFDVDGGTAIDPLTDKQAIVLSELPTAVKDGKNFGGWFKDENKNVPVVAEALTGDVTLYAKWLDPYTVAQAKAVIDANPTGTENQYVTGVISQIDSYNSTYKSITYWISADGTTENQLQVYSGKIGNAATALGKEDFSAKEDLELGDEVVVTGTLKLHNSTTYEFDKNNTIYTFGRKASAGLAYEVAAVEKVVGDDAFINPLTNPYEVVVSYESSDDQVAEVANDGIVTIVGEGSATITASFAGNPQYKAAQVSYTLTVSATVDTRHIANSPATFTTVSGDMTPNDITFASYQGGSSTAPAIYNDGIRLYQISGTNDFGGFITLTAIAGYTIDEVQITTTSKYATTVAYSKDGNENLLKSESVSASGSYTTGTGLNVSSVNILNLGTGSSGRLEIASIKVYYTGEAATIDHYELGGTYQTAFMQNEEFNHTGLIVYAVYDALGENKVDITSMCTFSDPDMSTTGEKTIEITYNEAVVASYTINVAADSRKVADSPATFTTVSGDMTPNDITFASYQGGASTAPANYNDGIRLYQAPSADAIGGFITLKAKKGCTIDQVKITTTNTYATTVAYSVDGNENLLGSESVAKSSDYSTPSGLNVESVNIVNKGTGSSGRLEIASIKVWYTGDALPVHHYILGGTYETVFEQFGTFSYEGLTVTAAYDEQETITEAVTGFTVEADLSTAGAAKANVMLNSVKIAEYDITVTESPKEDPALAYTPNVQVLAAEEVASWTAPAFSNTFSVTPITYSSDKTSVATVDENGVIALAGGFGTAVITAHFEGDNDYIESTATYTITVNEPVEDLSGTWIVATSVAAGDRIIIGATYQGNTKTMGAQNDNNRAAVASTYENLVLTPAEGTKTFTLVDAGDGKFAIRALNGKYLAASGTGTKNYLTEADDYTEDNAKWTVSIDNEGVASIVALSNNRNDLQYNNGNTIFSCYSTDGQKPVNIYKIGTPDYGSYQRDNLTAGNYGTICLPKAGTISGATLFEIADYDGSMIYVDEVLNGAMEAGKPYIFQATSEQLNVTYTSSAVEETAGNANGLYGFYNLENENAQFNIPVDNGNYILYSNQYWLVSGRAAYIANYRAYIKLNQINNTGNQAPGRRRVAMAVNGEQTATGVDALNAAEAPVKMMINGQLFILRGEKMYDVKGQLVK